MKAFLFFLFTISLAGSTVSAQKPTTASDSTINQNGFKQSQQYFLDTYGKDDSTRALINYYFRIRKATVVETSVGLLLTGGGLILLANPNTYILAIGFAPIIFTGALLFIDGPIERLIYNKKKLLHLIADYQHGKHFPKRFTHNRRFRLEMEKLEQ